MYIELRLEKAKEELIIFLNKLCKENKLSNYLLFYIIDEIYREILQNKTVELKTMRENLKKEEGIKNG